MAEESMAGLRLPAGSKPSDYYFSRDGGDNDIASIMEEPAGGWDYGQYRPAIDTTSDTYSDAEAAQRSAARDRRVSPDYQLPAAFPRDDPGGYQVVNAGTTGNRRGRQKRGVISEVMIRERINEASTGRYTLPELVAGKRGSPERRELALIVGSITRPEIGNPLNIEVLWTVLERVVSRKTLQRWAYSTETTKEAHVPQIATDGELGCAVAQLEQIAADIQEVARTIGSRFPTDRAVTEAVDRILSLVPDRQNTAVNVA